MMAPVMALIYCGCTDGTRRAQPRITRRAQIVPGSCFCCHHVPTCTKYCCHLAATMYQHIPSCCHHVPSRAQIVPPLPVPGATWMGKAENAKIGVAILRNTMLTLLHKKFFSQAKRDGLAYNPVRLERDKSVQLKLRRGADTRVCFRCESHLRFSNSFKTWVLLGIHNWMDKHTFMFTYMCKRDSWWWEEEEDRRGCVRFCKAFQTTN